ncbi:hypothetical protein [Candidatus Nitrososphaera evergladensis]|uniref:hypothetical protein n=1 Tax=Candidatus Nitrososphaera evergladensis TaxID=1459637 RepID=UPI0011E58BC3|nr:hypothetical protein [Candidatus Nitrososphaera evergladensis]
MDKDEFIRREREGDEKRRSKMFKERFPHIPVDKIKGSLTREKLDEAGERVRIAGERVRGAIQKAATYQPSERVERAKEAAVEVASTIREELQEAGDYYAGRGGGGGRGRGGRRSRKGRRARHSYQDAETQSVDDYYVQQNIANYAAAFSPPAFRLDWQGRPTGRRFESDVSYESVWRSDEPAHSDHLFSSNPAAGYLINFDFTARRSSGKKSKKSDDLIGRWFY